MVVWMFVYIYFLINFFFVPWRAFFAESFKPKFIRLLRSLSIQRAQKMAQIKRFEGAAGGWLTPLPPPFPPPPFHENIKKCTNVPHSTSVNCLASCVVAINRVCGFLEDRFRIWVNRISLTCLFDDWFLLLSCLVLLLLKSSSSTLSVSCKEP